MLTEMVAICGYLHLNYFALANKIKTLSFSVALIIFHVLNSYSRLLDNTDTEHFHYRKYSEQLWWTSAHFDTVLGIINDA